MARRARSGADCWPAFKELQDAGINFLIESFGPFGSPQHGCPQSFALPENLFAAYKLTVALGYTTIPTAAGPIVESEVGAHLPLLRAYGLAQFRAVSGGVRIDQLWTPLHRQALADYNAARSSMHTRLLQEDGQSVLWHDSAGKVATLWNFAPRRCRLPGMVRDLTSGAEFARGDSYQIEAGHTYAIEAQSPPVTI